MKKKTVHIIFGFISWIQIRFYAVSDLNNLNLEKDSIDSFTTIELLGGARQEGRRLLGRQVGDRGHPVLHESLKNCNWIRPLKLHIHHIFISQYVYNSRNISYF